MLVMKDEGIEGDIYGFQVKGVEVTKMAKVSKMTETTTRHVIIGLIAKNTEMAKMFIMTARHVMCSLGKPAVKCCAGQGFRGRVQGSAV
jgi:hypothetical protein